MPRWSTSICLGLSLQDTISWLRCTVLVNPVDYKVRKQHAAGRWRLEGAGMGCRIVREVGP